MEEKMNILILGAAGFIGTNLTLELAQDTTNRLFLFDVEQADFSNVNNIESVEIIRGSFNEECDFEKLIENIDIVFHLVSTTYPSNSNKMIALEMQANVIVTIKLLEACIKNDVKKVVFLSSGGTVYGKAKSSPLVESDSTYPISSYGIQKITIEKMLYLFNYLYELDYSVIRLANPYGSYQKPNSGLGAVTTFTYKVLMGEPIQVFGDGSVVRDYIYIDDVIRGILKITFDDVGAGVYSSDSGNPGEGKVFNLGSGEGHSLNDVINTIQETLDKKIDIQYVEGRKVDVPFNVLDISRYEKAYGKLNPISLSAGIEKLAEFMKKKYM